MIWTEIDCNKQKMLDFFCPPCRLLLRQYHERGKEFVFVVTIDSNVDQHSLYFVLFFSFLIVIRRPLVSNTDQYNYKKVRQNKVYNAKKNSTIYAYHEWNFELNKEFLFEFWSNFGQNVNCWSGLISEGIFNSV